MFQAEDRPRLARGVRLHWDPVRESRMLLKPEGAVTLNPSAASVVELCNGERTLREIVTELEDKHSATSLEDDVRELLADLAALGLVIHANG